MFAASFSEIFSSNSEHIFRTVGTAKAHATTLLNVTQRGVKNAACRDAGEVVSNHFPQTLKHYGLSVAKSEMGLKCIFIVTHHSSVTQWSNYTVSCGEHAPVLWCKKICPNP